MGVHFTEDQQRAIDTLDKSILVSAAAGSGKTAVLVERIIHIILEGKANVDEMLVVTTGSRPFASAMKPRVNSFRWKPWMNSSRSVLRTTDISKGDPFGISWSTTAATETRRR